MGVELVPTPKAPKNRSLAIRLIVNFYLLRMLIFGRSARVLKTLDMDSSLKGFTRESKIPYSILVHDLCGIEVYIVSFSNRI